MRGTYEPPPRGTWYYLGPPLYGAVAVFCIVALRAMGLLFEPHQTLQMWKDALLALAVGTGAGFAGGATYVIFGRAVRRAPHAGPYLAGIVTMAGYMGAGLAAFSFLEGKALIHDRASAVIFAAVTVLFGLVIGHAFRDRTPAQVAREKRTSSALKPLFPAVLAFLVLEPFVLDYWEGRAAFYILNLVGLVALIVAWTYLKRRRPPAPDPESDEYWDKVLPLPGPTDSRAKGVEHEKSPSSGG